MVAPYDRIIDISMGELFEINRLHTGRCPDYEQITLPAQLILACDF